MGASRVGYIDALRGFVMLLVVFGHVVLFSFASRGGHFSFNDIFMTVTMPALFFLSGFLFYRPGRCGSMKGLWPFLWGKIRALLIPTLIFSLLFAVIFQRSYIDLFCEKSKAGFWFTYTLFFFFVIYYLGDVLIGRILGLKGTPKLIFGLLIALGIYGVAKYSLTPSFSLLPAKLNGAIGLANFQHFLFFFLGAVGRRYLDKFLSVLSGNTSMAMVISGFILLEMMLFVPVLKDCVISTVGFSAYSLIKSIASAFGIVVLFAFFRKYFSENGYIWKSFQYIGERTLDIYLIHLFLIYVDLQFVGEFFITHHNPVLELFAALSVSFLIVLICLVISNTIRCSDKLAKLFFGKVITSNK